MQEFLQKYGYRSFGLLVARFIEAAPEFEGGKELARMLGEAIADLESALRDAATRT